MTKHSFNYIPFPLFNFNVRPINISVIGENNDYIFERIKESNNFYEETILSMFGLAMMGKKGYVIDAGANIGNHTIFVSKIVNRKTVSIEPSKKNVKYLKKNIKENNLERKVYVKSVAVSNKKRNYSTKKFRGNAGKTQLIEDDNGKVESVTIDKVVNEKENFKENVAGIKIDIEGMEREAIQGAKNTIRKYKPAIIIEDKESLVYDIIENFPECGYKIKRPLPHSPTFLLYSNNYLNFCKPFLSVWNRVRKFI